MLTLAGRHNASSRERETEGLTMTTVLRSSNLTCSSCVRKIERALLALDGVENATVHFTTGRIEVQHDPSRASADDMIRTIRATGYEARPGAF